MGLLGGGGVGVVTVVWWLLGSVVLRNILVTVEAFGTVLGAGWPL